MLSPRAIGTASRLGARAASGTPISALDPKGSTTVEQVYKKMESNLKVCVLFCRCVVSRPRPARPFLTLPPRPPPPPAPAPPAPGRSCASR